MKQPGARGCPRPLLTCRPAGLSEGLPGLWSASRIRFEPGGAGQRDATSRARAFSLARRQPRHHRANGPHRGARRALRPGDGRGARPDRGGLPIGGLGRRPRPPLAVRGRLAHDHAGCMLEELVQTHRDVDISIEQSAISGQPSPGLQWVIDREAMGAKRSEGAGLCR